MIPFREEPGNKKLYLVCTTPAASEKATARPWLRSWSQSYGRTGMELLPLKTNTQFHSFSFAYLVFFIYLTIIKGLFDPYLSAFNSRDTQTKDNTMPAGDMHMICIFTTQTWRSAFDSLLFCARKRRNHPNVPAACVQARSSCSQTPPAPLLNTADK